MTTFKPGDRIRNVRDTDTEIPIGYTARVNSVSSTSVFFDDILGNYRQRPAGYYELVTEQPTPFDATKLRKGDKVLVISTVLGDGVDEDGELFIQPGPYATLSQIIGYAPGYVPAPVEEPLKIRDKVSTNGYVGRIVFQDGGESVIRHLNGYLFIAPTVDLKRVPE